jgi:hypothetical protein
MKNDQKIILKLFYWTWEWLQLVQTWHNPVLYLQCPSASCFLRTRCTLLFYWHTQAVSSYVPLNKTVFCKLPYYNNNLLAVVILSITKHESFGDIQNHESRFLWGSKSPFSRYWAAELSIVLTRRLSLQFWYWGLVSLTNGFAIRTK